MCYNRTEEFANHGRYAVCLAMCSLLIDVTFIICVAMYLASYVIYVYVKC